LRPLSYPETDVFILLFSVSSPESFKNVEEKWFPEIHYHCPKVPFIIVGNKSDLEEEKITSEQGNKLAEKLSSKGCVGYLECLIFVLKF
jgi:cell division control protein 42